MQKILSGNRVKDIAACLFLILCSFFLLSNLFVQNQIFSTQDNGLGDLTHFNYPMKDFYAQELKQGELPLWTSEIYTGFPLLAENQVGTFFLPNLFLYYLFPTYLAFNLSYLLIFITASIGTYFYTRYSKLSRPGSLLAAIVYAYSFVFIGHIDHLNLLQEISLLPWLMLLGDKFFVTGSRIYFLLFAFLLSQQFFAGHIQETVYSAIGVVIICSMRYFRSKKYVKNLILYAIACLIAVGICSIQILPTLELLNNSTRHGLSASGFSYPFTLKDLAYFLNPYFWGDPSLGTYTINPTESAFWENNLYAGIIPLGLLLFGVYKIKVLKSIRPYFYLFLSILLFCLGFFFFLSYIPPFSLFRMNQRSLFLLGFSYAIIVGFVFDSYVLHFLNKMKSPSLKIFGITLIICVTLFDLFYFGKGYNGGISQTEWLKLPDTAAYLKSQNISGRVLSIGNFEDWQYIYKNIAHGWRDDNADKLLANRAMLYPNVNMYYGIDQYYGYTGVRTQNVNDMFSLSFFGSKLSGDNFTISSSSTKLLGMGNVQYLISSKPITYTANDLQLVWKKFNSETKTSYLIYKNNNYVPRIHAVGNIVNETSLQKIAMDLLNPNFNPQTTALMVNSDANATFPDRVTITNILSKQQQITFKTHSKGSSFVVIADTTYPGWKAVIDGIETPILETNISNKGIFIPSGNHDIKFYYDPQSFKNGILVTCITFCICLIVLFYPYIERLNQLITIKNQDNELS